MDDFISDLDAYFCENYADYDKLSGLTGYRMPLMQATKKDEFGREVGYTLPKTEMRLALQENKESNIRSNTGNILFFMPVILRG